MHVFRSSRDVKKDGHALATQSSRITLFGPFPCCEVLLSPFQHDTRSRHLLQTCFFGLARSLPVALSARRYGKPTASLASHFDFSHVRMRDGLAHDEPDGHATFRGCSTP